jgi:PleD family two-component response regulator
VRHERRAESTAGGALAGPDLSGLSILAVDDEADARQLIKRILSDAGAVV